jgi:hypothetical protein
MSTRYEIKAWRKSANDKAYTVRLGSAWTDQKGVLRLAFDALPLPDEQGRVSCFLEVPRERDGLDSAATGQKQPVTGSGYISVTSGRVTPRSGDGGAANLEDSIPF